MSLISAPVPLTFRRADRPRHARRLSLARLVSERWTWLVLVAALQTVLAKIAAAQPTAFQDEGLYIYMGHRIIDSLVGSGQRLIEFPGAYFSGAPGFYPVVAALADDLGGLSAVRDLSLVMMIVTMVGVQGIGEALFGRIAGLFGALTFAACGSVIYLSQWATFDSMAMMFAALAAWLAVSSAKNDGLVYAPLVGVLLFLSAFAKYAGAMYLPIVAALAVAVGWQRFGWRVVSRATFAVTTAVVLFFFVVLLFGRGLLPGLAQTTTRRQVLNPAGAGELAVQVLLWVGPWLLLAVVGGLFSLRRESLVVTVLLMGTVLGPLQQIHLGEATSLRKHVAFGLIFASALVGDLLARMLRVAALRPLVVAVVVLLGWHGTYFGGQFLTAYPADAQLQAILRQTLAANPGQPILAEQSSAQRYELMGITEPGQWHDTYVFNYRGLSGSAAYRQAIEDHYFGVIYLNFTTASSHTVAEALAADPPDERYYHLVAKVPGDIHGTEVGSWLVWTPQETHFTPI